MRLLIAEDDTDILRALTVLFQKEKYLVDGFTNGADAYSAALSQSYDGFILDIMMPQMDGLELLQALRFNGINAPVLLLTAKSEVEDRVAGLDAGADDYLPKPFAISELLARVRAMLRRREQYREDFLSYEGLTLDSSAFELCFQEQRLRLTGREYHMMELLLQKPGLVISTTQFIDAIWGWDSQTEVSVVWVYISNLRKKLQQLNAPIVIRALRGVGYCLERKDADSEHDT